MRWVRHRRKRGMPTGVLAATVSNRACFLAGDPTRRKADDMGSENHAPTVLGTAARFKESLEVCPAVRSDGEEFHLGRSSLAVLAIAAP